jgi:hypothetical protein
VQNVRAITLRRSAILSRSLKRIAILKSAVWNSLGDIYTVVTSWQRVSKREQHRYKTASRSVQQRISDSQGSFAAISMDLANKRTSKFVM